MMQPPVELSPSLKAEVSPDKWKRLVETAPGATVFHTLEWSVALRETFRDLSVKFIVIEDGDGNYVAGMPFGRSRSLMFTSFYSMPFGTYGGPIVSEGLEDEVFAFMSTAIQGVTRGVLPTSFSCVLFSTPVGVERAVHNACPHGRRVKASTHLINLEAGFKKLWDEAFDKETRTCARKAERGGLKVEEDTTDAGASALYSLYKRQAAQWGSRRTYPERLVHKVVERMSNSARIWVGRLNDVAVCAVLVFYFRDTLMAWLSGQDDEARKLCASHLVYSEILRHACEAGYSTFNFGASGELHGVRYFKESFGGREYVYPVVINESGLFRFARWLKRFTEGP